tara:strand:+ start:91 stop:606 length:516 start_codon:yes stop_codon:yes gene_type:complete
MRILFFSLIFFLQIGCSTIEVAKEVTKATESIKKTITDIGEKKEAKKTQKDGVDSLETENQIFIEKEKETVEVEKKEERKKVIEQKKIIEVSFVNKSFLEIKKSLGEPNMLRVDGKTKMTRFDTNNCRLFLFFNNQINNPKVKHFEIRDKKGNIINEKEKIQICYKNFNLT